MDNSSSKRVLAPLFDRLLDTDGDTSRQSRPQAQLKQLRESVRRDLESLFNTRARAQSPASAFKQLQTSLLNFGLPDLSTVNFSSKKNRSDFCRTIEQAILRYDPRIKTVKVSTTDKVDVEDPTIRFRVEAKLHANPAPEIIVFDSAFNPVNQFVDVAEIS